MKTFFLNIPKRLKLKSQDLDVQTAICDKAWKVFNDEGVKQLFIFRTNGALIISTNGLVTYSTWEYIPVNHSIIIASEDKAIMFVPIFMDDVLFALQQDGNGGPCLILINQQYQNKIEAQSIKDIDVYFSRIAPPDLQKLGKSSLSVVDETKDEIIQVTRKYAKNVNLGEVHLFEEEINGLLLHTRKVSGKESECWYEYFGERCSKIYKKASSQCFESVIPVDDSFLILTSNRYHNLLLMEWDVFFEHSTDVKAYTQYEFEQRFPNNAYHNSYEWEGEGFPFGKIYLLSAYGYSVRDFIVIDKDKNKAVFYKMSIENYSSIKQKLLGHRGKIRTYIQGERKDWLIDYHR